MYELKEFDTAFLEAARIAEVFGGVYEESVIEAAVSLARAEEAGAMLRLLQEIFGLESEKEATIILFKKCERREWREAAHYARERERARAQAYRLMMKHHKAREVMRIKRQKRICGGLI